MLSQEQFDVVCEEMIKEGIPLTELNLMMRTELPKKTVVKMLKKFRKRPVKEPPKKKESLPAAEPTTTTETKDSVSEVVVETVVKNVVIPKSSETLLEWFSSGLSNNQETEKRDTVPSRKEYFTGFGTGVLLGPLGLFYSSPWIVAFVATVVYFALLYVFYHIPVLGRTTLIPYLVLIAHIGSGLVGLFYTYKYNKLGKRVEL